MDFSAVFLTPEMPKLQFGEQLSDVCKDGVFHAGLKDLFLKAYLSAREGDCIESEDYTPRVLLALKPGPSGQGSLSQRISLKSKLERGEWLIPAQTPPGAPLWLLRHFLGRLPQPLLADSHWKVLAEACGEAVIPSPDAASVRVAQVLERIAISCRALKQVEFEVLALLALLIRGASFEKRPGVKEEPRDDALNALSQYFIASIIARPFRPGLYTAADKEHQPLLVFLAKHWDVLYGGHARINVAKVAEIKELGYSESAHAELYKYFREDRSNRQNRTRQFIGFESLLIIRDNEESKESSDNDNDSECLRKCCAADDLNIIKRDLILREANAAGKSTEEKMSFRNPKIEIISEAQALDCESEKTLGDGTISHVTKEKLVLEKAVASAACSINSKADLSFDLYENERETSADFKPDDIESSYAYDYLQEDSIEFYENNKNIGKSSSSEFEYFSTPNSGNSQ